MKFVKILLCWIVLLGWANALEVPSLRERITDEVGVLSESKKQELSQILESHELKTGNQIGVLIIPTLAEDSLEDFSIRVVEAWKLGQKDKDNGVLLLIVKNDRKIRIEVGYGLEGELTDAKSAQIIRNVIVPNFKNGNFAQGVEDGVLSIIHVLDPNTAGEPLPAANGKVRVGNIPFSAQALIFLILFVAVVMSKIFGMILPGRRRSSTYWGGFGGFGGGGGGGFSGGGGGFGGGGSSGSW